MRERERDADIEEGGRRQRQRESGVKREGQREKVLLCGRKVSLPAKEKGGDD